MPSYYIYLISSLPMLHFEAKPPFSFEEFLRMCEGVISDEDIHILEFIAQIREPAALAQCPEAKGVTILRQWCLFDTGLRNELVKIRAHRKHLDSEKYLRCDGYTDPDIVHLALHAHRSTSIIEAEKILDLERWRFLDELALGHYFDIDFLIVYVLKLLILERWERIRQADKSKLLEKILNPEHETLNNTR